jgi:ribosomal protein L11 methyltransferase
MLTHWWEIKVNYVSELEDTLFWRFEEFGCQGIAIVKEDNNWYVKGYIPSVTKENIDLAAFSLLLKQDFTIANFLSPSVSWKLIDDEDWATSWKNHWQPMEIGDRFVVYPAWIPVPSDLQRFVIRLDPGSAFGTGVHPTTQLCLEALEVKVEKGDIVADVGCGTGILAIASRMLGAKSVRAVDVDILAVNATIENAEFNSISEIEVTQGTIEQITTTVDFKFDGIVCNILAEIIKQIIPDFGKIIKPKGWVILSGILTEQQSLEVSSLLEADGWLINTLWQRGEWCCINATRKAEVS